MRVLSVRLQNFAPVKVRLKLDFTYLTAGSSDIFQFHKGTIKTHQKNIVPLVAAAFQFHKGTIKTLGVYRYLVDIIYFNSIKVRLKRGSAPAYVAKYVKFQFHKGTIKTYHS